MYNCTQELSEFKRLILIYRTILKYYFERITCFLFGSTTVRYNIEYNLISFLYISIAKRKKKLIVSFNIRLYFVHVINEHYV